ncbi:MAG TPA: hypothetical protein VHO90_20310, partial [Bacteroidales bacterium]|nr:hypothetical protein [Bacteroidales bacterium]
MDPQDDKNEIEKLFDEAMLHFKNNERGKADAVGKKILELDPDSFPGHYILAHAVRADDEQRYLNLKFIMDRNITYVAPGENAYDLVEDFLNVLRIRSYDCKDDEKYIEILNEIVEYSEKALKARMKISEIYEFAEVLEEVGRFEDVINIGYFLTDDKKAEEIGYPGLDISSGRDDLEIATMHVMRAFFELDLYEEGAHWMHKCLLLNKEDHLRWYYLGEALAWLGYPEETARAWIISIEKGDYIISQNAAFETLTKMMTDSNYEEKENLGTLVYRMKEELPPEKHKDHEDVMQMIYT